MKYDSSGKDLICAGCLAKENRGNKEDASKITKENVTNTADTVKSNSSEKIVINNKIKSDNNNNESKEISYQCGSCGFGFSKEKGAMINVCPYCGKGNFRIAFRDSAQKLIEEAQSKQFDD
ncbi:hypothetical protein CMO88_05170 [Candidatus Woesearchaeota archaeon]|nr:hypothetical protein [Candidatus Woesearchaeota archaeon]